jgi:hypothetical protein
MVLTNIVIVQCYREFVLITNLICALHIFYLLYHSTNLHMVLTNIVIVQYSREFANVTYLICAIQILIFA